MRRAGQSGPAPLARPSRRTEAGLSLIEMLVTLAIIAAASSLIVITAVPPDPVKTEMQRFRQTVEITAERAAITGIPAGIVIDDQSYQPAIWQDGTWKQASRRPHILPAGLSITAREDRARTPPSADEEGWPAIVFDPLGHSAQAEILVRYRDQTLTLTVSAEGVASRDAR